MNFRCKYDGVNYFGDGDSSYIWEFEKINYEETCITNCKDLMDEVIAVP